MVPKISADTLYLCYCIDKETGDRRRAEVFELVRFPFILPLFSHLAYNFRFIV